MRATIGVEEEFVLLDPATLAPVARADEALRALRQRTGDAGRVTPEFFPSQIEYASPVCTSAAELAASLSAFREALAGWADRAGVVAAAVGTPFQVVAGAEVTAEDRFRDIAGRFGRIVPDHQINGLHVHVSVGDRDRAVRAMNTLRPWLPVLLALSANSPFWAGEDTGFASWRAIHGRRWTTHGIPPRFRDAEDYQARVSALVGVGGTSDAGTINWVVRPSERFPTVETRVFDAQLDVGHSVALAVLLRAVLAADPTIPSLTPELLDAAYWHAARDGLDGDLLDPVRGDLRGAKEVVGELLGVAGPGLDREGDAALVQESVERILNEGNGATHQRRARRCGGVPGLAERVNIGRSTA